MLKKQAKILTDKQIKAVLAYLDTTKRNRLRNKVIFLLSLHSLRAKEIADLEISMVLNSNGEVAQAISLQDKASKGSSGRVIPMNKTLRLALAEYLECRGEDNSRYLVITERSGKFSANAVAVFFSRLYKSLGFIGCSSHSGRRTMITMAARKASAVGGSLRDVMVLAGHRNLQTTQRYVDHDPKAQVALIETLYNL